MHFFRLQTARMAVICFVTLFLLLPAVFGQGINISPTAPSVSAGGTVTITADRPVKFSFFGYGGISSTTQNSVVYQAPTGLYPQHLINGCMALPNDSVFNVRIDNLPVAANSSSLTPFVLSQGASFSFKWGTNVIDNTAPMSAQQFLATPQLNGTLFPALPQTSQKRQNGAFTLDTGVDHHMLSVNWQSCQFFETNQQNIALSACPTCTAESGWTYASTNYVLPPSGSGSADPSGLPLAALTLHVSEIRAGSVNHALLFTACPSCVSPGSVWPAVGSTGTQAGAPPVGTRFRLKSSFNISNYPTAAQKVLVALQRYGMILGGPGVDGEIAVSTDVSEDPAISQALQSLDGGALTYSNFDVVDESSYMLSPSSSAVNPLNGSQFPVSFALLTVTDAANSKNSIKVPIALQPVSVGTPEPSMTVQAGTPGFQIPYWVTGTANQNVNWTISPSTGMGTISPAGVYTAPTSVNNPQKVTLQLTSVVSNIPLSTTSIVLTIIPSGPIRIDSGSSVATVDDRGQPWLQDLGFETGNFTAVNDTSSQNAWSTTYNHTAWQTYTYTAGDDILYKFRLPNGSYAVQLMFGVGECSGNFSGQNPVNNLIWGPLDLQSQTSVAYANWNFGTPINYQCQTPETSFMLAQVVDNTLTVAVRATGGDGQHSTPLLNGLTITPVSSLASTNPVFSQSSTPSSTPTINIQQMDQNCGQPGYNCRAAFQNAFSMLAQTGGGTLTLGGGKYFLDFPEIPQNVTSGPWFTSSSLIAVPPNTNIVGHLGGYNVPDTVIQWSNTSTPIFVFAKANNSSIRNIHASFIGTTPTSYPYGDLFLLTALGYNMATSHLSTMSAGTPEMFSFAYVFDSDNVTFNNLLFDSATRDNNHIFSYGINVKGKGVMLNGGGLSSLANNNQIRNIQLYDFNTGLLVSGQNGLQISRISADRRGSILNIAPGHVLYTTGTPQYDSSGNLVASLQNTNLTAQNITEGPDIYNVSNAGGTLAIKYINGGTFDTVNSSHPAGLIQTLYTDNNITFSNMTWQSNYDICGNAPTNCGFPVIYSTVTTPQFYPIQNLTFTNISLSSTITPITVLLIGNGITVNGMNIQTPPTWVPGQAAPQAVLTLKGTNGASITNYTYTPLITSYNPKANYNAPFTGFSPTSNAQVQVTVDWPSSIPVPAPGSEIINSGFQDTQSNNTVTATIVPVTQD
jgi:hypothetical protein